MSATFLIDLPSVAVGAVSVAPQTIASATTVNGSAVDMLESDGPIHGVILNGDYNAAAAVTVKLQEASDTNGPWTDIANATLILNADASDNDMKLLFLKTDYRTKRYVRAVVTVAGTSPSAVVGVAVLGRKRISGVGTGFVS